jgi:S-DNA-T family DNA segregation ATPase FtsK/SpoIIIE
MPRKYRGRRYEEVEFYSLSPETKKGILIIFLFVIAIIAILSFLNLAGTAGVYIDWALGIALGWGRFILPLLLIGIGYVLARPNHYQTSFANLFGVILFFLSVHGLLHLRVPFTNSFELSFSGLGGGIVGYLVTYPLILYLGFWAGLIVLIGLVFAGILLMFNTGIEALLAKSNVFKYFSFGQPSTDANEEKNETSGESTEENPEDDKQNTKAQEVKFSPKSLLGKPAAEAQTTIKNPKIKIDLPLSLLDDRKSKPTSGDIKLGTERIKKTLENFNIPVEMGEVQVGPTVTQYTLKPSEGIKLSKITALSNDLALAMAAHPIRIEAPIPGKSLVGIEVPNQKPAIVRIREILESAPFKDRKTNLTVALGKDVSGKCWAADITSMPHMLVAGATGSGKSVCLNSIIMSLLYENNPETLRLILIDPKRVEFPIYNGIPHLLTPVITDVTKTVYALRWAITEMDHRFDILSKEKKRNIFSYNLTAKEKMPYLVIVVDELADLMVTAAAEVEGCIIRLTQMARAVGIHMVVATQRPSVDVITGLIKANIPCRVAFSVASLMDSRTILDTSGAEKLVGKGDMLYMTPETAKPRRLQGAYVSDDEIKRVVDFLKNACHHETEYQEEIVLKPNNNAGTSFDFNAGGNDDELFEEAKETVIRSGKASASLLQRRLRVGYARAARLIDLMEEAGIVSAADGAKPRDILVDKNQSFAKAPTSFSPAADMEIAEKEEGEDEDNNITEDAPFDPTEDETRTNPSDESGNEDSGETEEEIVEDDTEEKNETENDKSIKSETVSKIRRPNTEEDEIY